MTARALWIALAVSLLLIALGGYAVYRAGESRGEAQTKVAALLAHQDEQRAHELELQRTADSTRRVRDSLTDARRTIDSLRSVRAREAAAAVTAAHLVRASTAIAHDTVTITSDSGPVAYPVPHPVAVQWVAERAAEDRAAAAASAQHAADSLAIENRDSTIATDALHEIQRDSIDATIRAQLADANAANKILQKEAKPRFTFGEGLVTGAAAAGLAKLALVLVGL